MKTNCFFAFFLLFSVVFSYSQKNTATSKDQSVGVCFGNAAYCNGIHLHVINGMTKSTNGLSFGLIASLDSSSNGLKIGTLAVDGRHNGLALAGLVVAGRKTNGCALAGLYTRADTMNGFFAAGFGVMPVGRPDTVYLINGLAIAGYGVSAQRINGVAMSFVMNVFDEIYGLSAGFFNAAEQLHGVQFGFLNYAGNNRKCFRWVPLVNMHFRKKSAG